ncbi:MAG: single-stranded DNA-binding protein [Pseudopedobacter saltans]|uniref:Single-stranded DNA-binding protein n=1 Tax=Pseudopedobacter saltans TaxID=151895 RepID=A0A2W5EVW5_9SPHI|nr:MAG: single-stranded DNA-binding protein [Pseudopedobacter saltans]
MIKLTAIGNLGRDCVTNEVNGRHVINFSVAHTERFKDQEKTIWVECAYWTERLGIAPYLKKGTTVYVEGTPDIRIYQTNDGRQGASLTLRVQSVQLVGARSANGEGGDYNCNTSTSSPTSAPSSFTAGNQPTSSDDVTYDLPF